MTLLSKQMKNYLNHCEHQKRLDSKTLKAYRIDLTQLSDFLQQQSYSPNKEGLEKYIERLHQRYKPKTVKRKLACIKTFFGFLEFEKEIPANPFAKLKIKFREHFILPKTIPADIVQKILYTAYRELGKAPQTEYQKKTALRDVAILELLFAIGARVSELCSLSCNDIDLQRGTVKINGKGSKERIIQIGNSDVLNMLVQYSAAFEHQIAQNDYFFLNKFHTRFSEQSVRAMIKKYVGMSGLSIHITPHMFRHTFATLLLRRRC